MKYSTRAIASIGKEQKEFENNQEHYIDKEIQKEMVLTTNLIHLFSERTITYLLLNGF